jgi:trans-2,3-dihydro-3-hydroxyanthranilate isomerase
MSRIYRYRVVDVFTRNALEGNPLAVFLDPSGLDGAAMQKIAGELNLSETVFLQPPGRPECAIGIRIFTPARELPFAGHPTIGTAFVAIRENLVPDSSSFIIEEKVGPVPVRAEAGDPPLIWLTTPPIHFGPSLDSSLCATAVGLDPQDLLDLPPQVASAGNPTLFIPVKNPDVVDRSRLDNAGYSKLKPFFKDQAVCVFVFAPAKEGAYSRMFAPEHGVSEDPATGSSTGPLALYMMRHKLVSSAHGTRFVSEQGKKMGRRSLLHVAIRGEQGAEGIDVGGYVTPLIEATLTLP